MKRVSTLWTVGLVLLLMISTIGCSSNKPKNSEVSVEDTTSKSQEVTSENNEAKKEVKLTALIMQSRNYEGLQRMIQKLKEEENIIIDAQIVPDNEGLNIIKMRLNSGQSPDLIDFNIPAIYDIVDPVKNFADLSDEPWIDSCILPDKIKHTDGKTYGFTFQSVTGIHGMIYNKDIFNALDMDVPTTWEELLDACETIKNSGDGIVPIYIPKDSWVPQILMTDNFVKGLGGEKQVNDFATKVMENKVKWNEVPELQMVIDRYLDLFKRGYINTNFMSATYDDAIAAVANKKAAMHFNGDFFGASVMEANPNANIGIFGISITENGDYLTAAKSSPGFVVYKNSKKLDIVKKVLQLWSTPEYANLYFEKRPGFPAFPNVDGGNIPEYLQDLNEKYITKGKIVPEFNASVMALNPLFDTSLYIYYIDYPAKEKYDAKSLLDKFQKDYEQYMKDQGNEAFK